MKRKYWLQFILLLVGILPLCAQDTQAFLDNEGKTEVITASLSAKLGLFREYTGFREARLFEVSENEFVLEIYYKPEDRILRKRIPFSKEEVSALRNQISKTVAEAKEDSLDQSGRVKLLITSTVAGMGYYGYAIPLALHMKSGKAIASTYMLTSALSFYVPYALTRNSTVTDAAANAYLYGTTRGALHGLALNVVSFGDNDSYRRALGFTTAGSMAEAIVFYKLSSNQKWSNGKVEIMGVGADFGAVMGWAVPYAFNYDGYRRAHAGSGLIGAGVGFAAGNQFSKVERITQGDAYVIRGAGMMGAYTSISLIDLFRPSNERWYARTFLAGTLGGLYLGQSLIRQKDFTSAQGFYVEIGQLAGWLTGLGLAYLIRDPEKTDNSRLFSTMSAIGGISGYTLMYRSFAEKAQKKAERTSWNLHLMPQNLLVSRLSRFNTPLPLPLAVLDVKF